MLGIGLGLTGRGGGASGRLSLDLDFTTGTLPSEVTFTRASTAWGHNSSGVLTSYSTNTPVFNYTYNGSTWSLAGLRLEEARTNLVTNSYNLAYTGWGVANIFAKTPYAGLAPDGTWTATLLEDNSTSAAQYTDIAATVGGADTNYATWSLYVKAGTSDMCHLRAYLTGGSSSLGSGVGFNFTFSTATVGTPTGTGGQGTPTATDVGATNVGNGWYRLWLRIQNNNTGNTNMTCRIFPQNTSTAATGTIYAWGAQAEVGSFPTSYLPTIPTWTARASAATYYNSSGVLTTAASGAVRSAGYRYDGTSWVLAGTIFELAVTNQMPGAMTNATYWQGAGTTITTGQTAPDGTTGGFLLTEAATGVATYGASPLVAVVGAMTSGQAVTSSVFAKAGTCNWLRLFLCDATTPTYSIVGWFNLTTGVAGTLTAAGGATLASAAIQNVGNGWFRCSVSGVLSTATTFTQLIRMASADNTTTDAGSKTMLVFGPQIEIGSSVTSYIPTTTAAVARNSDSSTVATATRAADVATLPLGTWYNATEGTVYSECSWPDLFGTVNSVVWQIDDGTANNRIFMFGAASSTNTNFDMRTGGVQQLNISRASWVTAGGVAKIAGAWATNDAQASFGGTLGTADTSVTVPTGQTTLRLGATSTATQGRMHLRRLRFYRARLSNAELTTLTT